MGPATYLAFHRVAQPWRNRGKDQSGTPGVAMGVKDVKLNQVIIASWLRAAIQDYLNAALTAAR